MVVRKRLPVPGETSSTVPHLSPSDPWALRGPCISDFLGLVFCSVKPSVMVWSNHVTVCVFLLDDWAVFIDLCLFVRPVGNRHPGCSQQALLGALSTRTLRSTQCMHLGGHSVHAPFRDWLDRVLICRSVILQISPRPLVYSWFIARFSDGKY